MLKVITVLVFVLLVILFIVNLYQRPYSVSRKLSASLDLNTGENIKNVNGTIPEVTCQLGHYRPKGSTILHRVSGQRQDGCYPCPKGRYGDKMGLTHYTCSGLCPVGTYGDETGLTSVKECKACRPGTFSVKSGATSRGCSGVCPKGKYSDHAGAKECKVCPKGYYMWQCIDT
jgi:hypothetical protein